MSLYENIHKKRKRIAAGSKERMRKPGTKGAPTAQDFKDAAKTAKGKKKKKKSNGGKKKMTYAKKRKTTTMNKKKKTNGKNKKAKR